MSVQGGAQQRFGCYIGNIDSTVSLDMLKQVFCSCGTIIDASLNGRTEDPYRFGFIDFSSEEARAKALKYNGFTLVGRKLRVNVSKGNVGKPEGYGNPSPRENRQPLQQQQQMGFAPAAPAPTNGLSAAEHQQAQLLLQLIQQGSVDPKTLTEAQRTLLVAVLSGGGGGGGGGGEATSTTPPAAPVSAAMPAPQMPPPMGMYNPMWGGMPGQFGAMGPYGGPMMAPGMMMGMYGQQPMQQQQGHQRPPRGAAANPPPPEELVKLREIQRKQFLKVVKEETEEYEGKLKERESKGGDKSGDDSSDSDGDDGHAEKKAKMELSDEDEKSNERGE